MASHDKGHTKRVTRTAVWIAQQERANIHVVRKAAELHDIARDMPDHAIEGAIMAKDILKGYESEFVEQVAHCIESHSFTSGVEPQTLEARVLSDADKLDAMGAIGVARAFLYSGESGRTIEDTLNHFENKLLHLIDEMKTETGKKLAEERHNFLLKFYQTMREELNSGGNGMQPKML
ncbi:MAG: HD domain-containing protein [Halobacteriota archaeon]